MKCFYHNKIEAVGVCKNCSKGLCMDCLTDLIDGIACKDRCEAQVEYLNEMTKSIRKMRDDTADVIRKTNKIIG